MYGSHSVCRSPQSLARGGGSCFVPSTSCTIRKYDVPIRSVELNEVRRSLVTFIIYFKKFFYFFFSFPPETSARSLALLRPAPGGSFAEHD